MSDPPKVETPLQRLRRRKIVRWALAYLAGAWVFFEVVSLVGETWDLPTWPTRLLSLVLVVGLAVVLILAWYHGERGRQRVSLIELVLIGGVLLTGGILVMTVGDFGRDRPVPPTGDGIVRDKPFIAVLPLDNFSPDADHSWFADALHERIISRLVQISGMETISRSSVVQYATARPPIGEIATELGVGFILEGSTTRAGRRVSVVVRLVEATSGASLWNEEYDNDLSTADLIQIQRDIAEQVARALAVEVLPTEAQSIAGVPTDDDEAYDYFLQAVALADVSRSRERSESQAQMYVLAVDRDPDFAAAWARLARVRNSLEFIYGVPGERAKAKLAVDRAEELEPGSLETLLAQGYYYYHGPRDFARALEYFARALEIAPSSISAARASGLIKPRQGRWEEGVQIFESVRSLDPRSYNTPVDLAWFYRHMRRFSDAIRAADDAIRIAPQQWNAYEEKLLVALSEHGDTVAARSFLESLPSVLDEATRRRWDARIAYYRGDYAETLSLAPRQEADDYNQMGMSGLNQVGVAALLAGDTVRATAVARDMREVALQQLRAVEGVTGTTARVRSHRDLSIAYALLGEAEASRTDRLTAIDLVPLGLDAEDGVYVLQDAAVAAVLIGDHSDAIEYLETLLAVPSPLTVGLLRMDPLYRPLRDHPAFEALIGG